VQKTKLVSVRFRQTECTTLACEYSVS